MLFKLLGVLLIALYLISSVEPEAKAAADIVSGLAFGLFLLVWRPM